MTRRISRRTVLKGFGAALALPYLEAMAPRALGAPATAAVKSPRRMLFVYVPNGVNMREWTPSKTGKDYELTGLLQSLSAFKNDFQVLTGLTCDKARANGDGPGDHARAQAAFLTGCQARKTAGADISVGISVDQLCAQKVGDQTRLPSLEIGCDAGALVGNCDSGYSCAYSANLSWRAATTPQPKEVNPKLVFERLFSSKNREEAAAARALRDRYRKSILDLVAEDAGDLNKQLGAADQRKLDEYLTGVREVEQRIARSASTGKDTPPPQGVTAPVGIPREYREHIRLLTDVMVLAFQGDVTRIGTFVYANEGSNRPYRFIEVPEGHHDLSHHGGDKAKLDKIKKINQFHLEQFGYLLGKLKAIKEADGTVLDNSMILYGSGNSDGNRHNHDDLPVLLAGKAGGTLTPGQHTRVVRETPIANLYIAMLERMGVRVEKFGDSKGKLMGI